MQVIRAKVRRRSDVASQRRIIKRNVAPLHRNVATLHRNVPKRLTLNVARYNSHSLCALYASVVEKAGIKAQNSASQSPVVSPHLSPPGSKRHCAIGDASSTLLLRVRQHAIDRHLAQRALVMFQRQ